MHLPSLLFASPCTGRCSDPHIAADWPMYLIFVWGLAGYLSFRFFHNWRYKARAMLRAIIWLIVFIISLVIWLFWALPYM